MPYAFQGRGLRSRYSAPFSLTQPVSFINIYNRDRKNFEQEAESRGPWSHCVIIQTNRADRKRHVMKSRPSQILQPSTVKDVIVKYFSSFSLSTKEYGDFYYCPITRLRFKLDCLEFNILVEFRDFAQKNFVRCPNKTFPRETFTSENNKNASSLPYYAPPRILKHG